MAVENVSEQAPLFPSEWQPEDFKEHDRVLALYFRSWMDSPKLVHGVVTYAARYEQPAPNGSPGFVSIRTRKNSDNPTGSIIGIDVGRAALIPENAWEHMDSVAFRAIWIEDGSLAWSGEREMLEGLLNRYAGNGGLESLRTEEMEEGEQAREHDDLYGRHHPTHALEHTKLIPGSKYGKVGKLPPIDEADLDSSGSH